MRSKKKKKKKKKKKPEKEANKLQCKTGKNENVKN